MKTILPLIVMIITKIIMIVIMIVVIMIIIMIIIMMIMYKKKPIQPPLPNRNAKQRKPNSCGPQGRVREGGLRSRVHYPKPIPRDTTKQSLRDCRREPCGLTGAWMA